MEKLLNSLSAWFFFLCSADVVDTVVHLKIYIIIHLKLKAVYINITKT